MKPLGISINQLARDLDVPPNRIGAIVNGTRSITADTALRLGTYFLVSPESWLGPADRLRSPPDSPARRQTDYPQHSHAAGRISRPSGPTSHSVLPFALTRFATQNFQTSLQPKAIDGLTTNREINFTLGICDKLTQPAATATLFASPPFHL